MPEEFYTPLSNLLHGIATVLLVGRWEVESILFRLRGAGLDESEFPWVRPLVERLCREFPGRTPPVYRQLISKLNGDYFPWLCRELAEHEWTVGRLPTLPPPVPQMAPVSSRLTGIGLPILPTVGSLANWLGVTYPELLWFSDCRGWERSRSTPRLRHYQYRWLCKSAGRKRLIEIPKTRLRLLQRRLHDEVLSLVPPHFSAHGFRRGRSILSALPPHTRKHVVLHMDINEFFPSIDSRRVNALFRTVGFPEEVARLLTGLCTNTVPGEVLDGEASLQHAQVSRYGQPHLPQGAPTSPVLANLLARRLDARLSGLAAFCDATYTRYADDLVFSGQKPFARRLRRFRLQVCTILLEEGFRIQARKTRVMFSGQRQQVAGLVLNDGLNTTRQSFDELKAILHNCGRLGPDSQNTEGRLDFRAHLRGRVAWHSTVNAQRGRKLRDSFEMIDWPET